MVVMGNLPSQGMGRRSAAILSSLLPVAVIGGLSSQTTTTTAQSFIQVSGQVTGCPLIFVVEVPAILVVHTSVSLTFAFLAPWFKAQSLKNARDHSLPLHPRQLQVPHQEEPVKPKLARTTTEQI
jgi:hypothetical protein